MHSKKYNEYFNMEVSSLSIRIGLSHLQLNVNVVELKINIVYFNLKLESI